MLLSIGLGKAAYWGVKLRGALFGAMLGMGAGTL